MKWGGNMHEVTLDPMIQVLQRHVDLGTDDVRAMRAMSFQVRTANAGDYLVRKGMCVQEHIVLLSGCAQRHRVTLDGGRQIVALQLPGEAISYTNLFFDKADDHIQALTTVAFAAIPSAEFRELVLMRCAIGEAVLRITQVESSISSEWMLNIGRRPARLRIALLYCELAARLDAAGLSDGTTYHIPLTQQQIGDALGLTAVHVNRTLKELYEDQLILRTNYRVYFPDRDRLESIVKFDSSYLKPWQSTKSGKKSEHYIGLRPTVEDREASQIRSGAEPVSTS